MSNTPKKVYASFLLITSIFFTILLVFFAIDPEETGGEGEYLVPGDGAAEAFYPLFIVSSTIIYGIIGMYIITKIFLKIYINTLGKDRKIGLFCCQYCLSINRIYNYYFIGRFFFSLHYFTVSNFLILFFSKTYLSM